MLRVLLAALATGLATTIGAVPFLWARISRRAYDSLLGLGAGLMLAAATLGLLATALGQGDDARGVSLLRLGLVVGGFLAGVGLLSLMDWLIPHEHAGGHHGHVCPGGHEHEHEREGRTARKQGLLVVGAMALHRLPEGFAVGAAYAVGGRGLGLTLAVAIAVQNAVEGAVMAAPLRRGGLSAGKLIGLVTATGLAVPLAAIAGFLLTTRIEGALPPMLALASGALIYLTCNEIIPESHSHGNEVRATFGIIAGFLFLMVLQQLVGHWH